MLVPMQRIDIVVPRSSARTAMRAVHRTGLVHLVAFEPPPGAGGTVFGAEAGGLHAQPLPPADRVAELATLLGSRPAPPAAVAALWDLPDDALAAEVARTEPVAADAQRLTARRVSLAGEAARLESYRQLLRTLAAVVGQLPRVRGYASTGIVVAARYRPVIALVRDELEALTHGRCAVVAADDGPDRIAAILLYPTRDAPAVEALLGGRDIEEVTLPEAFAGVPFDQLEPRLAAEQARLREELDAVDRAFGHLASAEGARVSALRLVLADRTAEEQALAAAGGSDHAVIVAGWIPAERVADLRSALDAAVGPTALVVEREGDGTAPQAPVAMANGPLLRAFEPLAAFVAVPRYGTLDPTPTLAITFPAFVGLMVADVGYGLTMLAILLLARWRRPALGVWRVLWPVGLAATTATIAFGLLFGEYFGETGRSFGLQPLWFDRRENIELLLVLALAIGVGQVGVGLVLGIANARTLHHRREAINRGAMLAALVAGLVLLAAAVGIVGSELAAVAAGALVLAAVILLLTVGVTGPIELLGTVGNVLSYSRLMAIGLAGVMLALVASRLGEVIPNVVLGLLVAVTLHALNLVLGVFDASIQGLRLHYVEFFTKFVEPGGARYAPFRAVVSAGASAAGGSGGT